MSAKIAGIDVHEKVLMVVVMDRAVPEEKPERRRFSTMPTELHHLSIWLREADSPLVLLDCLTGVPLTASTSTQCLATGRQPDPCFDRHLARYGGASGEKHSYLEDNIRCSPDAVRYGN